MAKKLAKSIIAILIIAGLFSAVSVYAQAQKCDASKGETCLIVPLGKTTKITNIGEYIRAIYQLGLGLGGLFAMLFIVYGGIIYTASAGNPSKQGEAKDIITNALWGLVLLLGAFLILNTIDPKLTGLKLATPPSVRAPQISGQTSQAAQQQQTINAAREQAILPGLTYEQIKQQRQGMISALGLTSTDNPNPTQWGGWDELNQQEQQEMAQLNADYFSASSKSIEADLKLAQTIYDQYIKDVSTTPPYVAYGYGAAVVPSDFEKVQSAATANTCANLTAGLAPACRALRNLNDYQSLYLLSVANTNTAQRIANQY